MVAEPQLTHKIWTYDEVRAIDDDVRRELHDGEIYQMPSPTLNHQNLIGRLYLLLMMWAQHHGGNAYLSPVDLCISPRTTYIPDLVFYSAAQMQSGAVERDPKCLTLAPFLVVEVLLPSTARNDRTLKTRAYAEFGIAHYWILDPAAQTLEAFELRENRYSLAGAIGAGETYAPAAFPDLTLRADDIFPAAPDSTAPPSA